MNGLPRGGGLVFCIGAHKGGTSWLYETLLDSPSCHLGATNEMHYFNDHAETEMSHLLSDHGLTGTNRARRCLDKALAAVPESDVPVVPKLDRLARSVPDARRR